jgi:Spy/CpxP family protein refolding chaperone
MRETTMSRNRLVLTAIGGTIGLLAVATLSIGVAHAQQAGAGQGQDRIAMHGRGMMRVGPLGMMRIGLARLGLSADQKEQIRAIVRGRAAEFKSVAAEMRRTRRAVNNAIANDAGESAIRAASAEMAKVQADMAALRAGLRKQVFSVLTPEQQAKAKELRLKAQARAERLIERRRKVTAF